MRLLHRPAAVLACVLPVAGFAQTTSVDQRLDRLETELQSLRHENEQLRAELGLKGRPGQTAPAVKPAGDESALRAGGMIQAQADFGDKGDARFGSAHDRFYLRRARLNLQGSFLEHFAFRIEGEFASSLGEGSGNRAQMTDGYLDWNRYDFATVRVGQSKTPFGYEQLAPDPQLFTVERTLANDRLTASRQIGVQAGGSLFGETITYATGVFNGTGVNTSANDNDRFMWIGRLSAVPWRGTIAGAPAHWSAGADAFTTDDRGLSMPGDFGLDATPGGTRDNLFAGRCEAGGLDPQLHAGPFDVWAEYLRARFKPLAAIPASSFDADGWYLMVAYFVVPKTLQAVVKYDEFDPNLSLGHNATSTGTFGANWYLKANDLKLQFDYLLTGFEAAAPQQQKLLLRLQTVF